MPSRKQGSPQRKSRNIQLDAAQSAAFAKTVLSPAAANPRLRRAFARYRREVRDSSEITGKLSPMKAVHLSAGLGGQPKGKSLLGAAKGKIRYTSDPTKPTLPVGRLGKLPKGTKPARQKPIAGLPDFAVRRKRLSTGILPVSAVQQLDKALADCEGIFGVVSLPTDPAPLREKIRRRLAAKRRHRRDKLADSVILALFASPERSAAFLGVRRLQKDNAAVSEALKTSASTFARSHSMTSPPTPSKVQGGGRAHPPRFGAQRR